MHEYSLIGKILHLVKDGKALHRDIKRQCKRYGKSENQLCEEAKVSISTFWRWDHGAEANLKTLKKLDRIFCRWERQSKQESPKARI